jgi:hypothetical protein
MGTHTEPASDWTNALYIGMAVTAHNAGDTNGATAKFSSFMPFVTIPVVITSQPPATLTVVQDSSLTLSVGASGDPINFQWYKGTTAISNANTATYTVAFADLVDAGTYTVVVSNSISSVTSSSTVVTVTPDTTPPSVTGATAFPGGSQVGIRFSKILDRVSAGTAANYKVNGVTATSAVVRTNVANELTTELNLVSLTVPTVISNTLTITISGVKDNRGNAMPSTNFTGTVLNLTLTDIGSGVNAIPPGAPDPQFPSTVVTWGPGAFDVLAGGNDIYNDADGFSFVWEPKTNAFDVRVQVVSVSQIDNWSAGSIEVREGPPTTNGGGWELARHYFCKVDYGGPTVTLDASGSGANTYEYNARLTEGDPTLRETANSGSTGGGSLGWGGTGPGNPSPVPYPNAWIRIARVQTGTNDHLLGYSGSDGINWSLRQDVDLNDANHAGLVSTVTGTNAGPWPSVCYVGLGSTSHNNGINNTTLGTSPWYSPTNQPFAAYVIYRNFGDVPAPVTGITLTSVITGGNLVVSWNGTGTLQSKTNLLSTTWTVVGTANPATIPLPASGNLFLRVSSP